MSLPLDLMMFGALIAFILLGYPVAFTIAGVATGFALLGWMLGDFNIQLMGAMGQRFFGVLTNPVLTAIPLFVLMGGILEKSRIAEDLLETMGRLFGKMNGGLGVSVVLVGALLAASTGIVGATVVAMGLIALPTMLRNGYDPKLASGMVCTAGTLGQIIPPSTLLIILADVMSNAFQQAQYAQGKFTIETISVGQTFAAAMVPGLLLVAVYCVYIIGRAKFFPGDAPAMKESVEPPSSVEIASAIVPPILLIIAVLGSILGGVASPNEAASVGAVGAILLAGRRLGVPVKLIILATIALLVLAVSAAAFPVRLQRSDVTIVGYVLAAIYAGLALFALGVVLKILRAAFADGLLKSSLLSTLTVTSMIFATILMASFFSLVFVGLGGEDRVHELLKEMPGGATGALIFAMLFVFVLGFFLDFVEISVILLPVLIPPLILMGIDPIWLTVLIAINLQTSFLTPPFGFSLFYLRGAAPKEITTGQIYRGVVPFIGLQSLPSRSCGCSRLSQLGFRAGFIKVLKNSRAAKTARCPDLFLAGRAFALRRGRPKIDVGVLRCRIDFLKLGFSELEIVERADTVNHLGCSACPNEGRRDAAASQDPGKCHLRQCLPAPLGNGVECPDGCKVLVAEELVLQGFALCCPAAFRNVLQILVCQHALGEWGKGDGTNAEIVQGVEKAVFFHPTVEHGIARLMDQTGSAELLQDCCCFSGPLRIVRGNTDV